MLILFLLHKILFNGFRWVVLKKLFQKYIQQWSTFYVQKRWNSQKNKGIKILTYNVHWKNPAPTNGFAVSANRRVKNIHLNSLHLGINNTACKYQGKYSSNQLFIPFGFYKGVHGVRMFKKQVGFCGLDLIILIIILRINHFCIIHVIS